MLSHLVEICKRRDADSYKTSEGVSTLPVSLYSYKKPCAGAQSGKRSLYIGAQTQEFMIR